MSGSSHHLGSLMKPYRHFSGLFVAVFVVFVVTSAADGQSLGETARKLRQNKPAETSSRVITNDDLRQALTAEPAKPEPDESRNGADIAKPSSDEAAKAASEGKKSDPEADQEKLDADWKARIDAQKQQIDGVAHELDLLQRENKLRAAAYYADAGTRLRNQQSYAADDRKYQKEIADKQKALDDAKTKLSDLQEQARKAGASARARE